MGNKIKKGKLIIFSAPSGSGKTTLVKHVLSSFNDISFSISACTRKKRINEINDRDYYFLTVNEFKQKIKEDAFVEWEEVYTDLFYGTLNSEIERIVNSGKHIAFDVDVEGGLNIKKKFGKDALAIFIKPPSIEELKNRLLARATDTDDVIQTRLDKAEFELSFEEKFDVTIINDDLQLAKTEIVNLISNFIVYDSD